MNSPLTRGWHQKCPEKIKTASYILHLHSIDHDPVNEEADDQRPRSGNYSRLACEFQFVRSMGYYLIQIYIPASLIVVISWVSFW